MADTLKDDLAGLRIEREPESRGAGRLVGWLVVLALLAAGGYYGWRWYSAERPIEVEVATVTERAAGAQAAVLNAAGYVTARRRATVSSKITGKVIEVNVEEGMAVKEGQVLARLDDEQARAGLALAQAQLEATRRAAQENEVRLKEARQNQGRYQALVKDGFATQLEVDRFKAEGDSIEARMLVLREQVKVGERQIALQQTDLDNTVIRAPFSGVAISKNAQPGEMISPVSAGGGFTRTGICTIVDMRSLEVEVDVNEAYIGRVRPNQDVTAVLDAYPDFPIPARVITAVPTADRQKATVLVRIAFKKLDPRILPDMGVKVTFLREADETPVVVTRGTALAPKAAIKSDGASTIAFVLTGDTVERRAVKAGGMDGDRMEILAGLTAGERVVIAPPPALANGMKVRIRQ
jgi:RND family efflux transporter MFP subunit